MLTSIISGMPGPSQRSQLFKCLPQGREHTCIGEHAASFLGKVAIKKWSQKIGEMFLFPPKNKGDIEDVHFLLNLNFPCFFHKKSIPTFSDIDDFLKSPLRWGSATLTISGPKGPPDSSMPMGPNSYHQICRFIPSLCCVIFERCDTAYDCFLIVVLCGIFSTPPKWSTVANFGSALAKMDRYPAPSSAFKVLFGRVLLSFVNVLTRFELSVLVKKKHRKGSCCFFRTLDRTWRNIKAIWPSFSHKKLALKNFCWRFNELWIRLILFKCCSWQPRNAEHLGVPMKTTVRKEVRKH